MENSIKMGADKLAENTPNAPKIIFPISLSKPKSLGLKKKLSLGVPSPCQCLCNVAKGRIVTVHILSCMLKQNIDHFFFFKIHKKAFKALQET